MNKFRPGDDVGPLEFWPFEVPESNYVIVEGAPKTYGRIDAGGVGHTTRYGIWHCTKGTFECTEQGDEMMTILSGRCRITQHETGETCDLGAGDTMFVRDGDRVTWQVTEDLSKVFFGHKSTGY
ncbi:MAG: cupin domain-containing protein [Sulfitobacter sp.]